MSMPHQVTVTCEQCAKGHPFTAWESLNVTLDPDAKDKLLEGQLTRFTCPDCGWSGQVCYSMLYHDMKQPLMIWLWLKDGDPDPNLGLPKQFLDDYTFRVVRSHNHLLEKIFIFDAGLDDRVMEFLKLLLCVQAEQDQKPLGGELLFCPSPPEPGQAEAITFEIAGGGNRMVSIPRQAYDQLAQSLAPKLPKPTPGQWLRVDSEFAKTLL